MKSILITILGCTCSLAYSQAVLSDFYKQWLAGYENFHEEGYGLNLIDFNNGSVTVETYDSDVNFWIDDAGSVITDSLGQLALITNGCDILDSELSTISGGDALNGDDYFYTNYCERGFKYPSLQSSYFIPKERGYRIIHADVNRDLIGLPITNKVYCTDFEESGVVSKRILLDSIYTGGRFFMNPLNIEGDFIIIVIPYHSNSFMAYKMEEDIFTFMAKSSIGPEINTFTNGDFTQVAISSAGHMIAINNDSLGLMVYDFDQATGQLSNYRAYRYPVRNGRGLCFSPSDQYVYVSNGEHIFQIDITTDPDDPDIYDYGNQYIAGPTGWPIGVGGMLTGPDCNIYVAPSSSTNYMHVIHNPDEQGAGAGLEKHIQLPMRVSHDFPNVPNLFSSCDSTIAWEITTSVVDVADNVSDIYIYPNPSAYTTIVSLPVGSSGKLYVYDVMGQLVHIHDKESGSSEVVIDMSDWDTGTYQVMYYSKDGVMQGRMVKM